MSPNGSRTFTVPSSQYEPSNPPPLMVYIDLRIIVILINASITNIISEYHMNRMGSIEKKAVIE